MRPSVRACLATVFVCAAWASLASAAKPQRIVSLNLCTDQLLMLLVDRERIAAVSYLARRPESSVLHAEAAKLPITYAQAEDVYVRRPDLVLAGTFTARATVAMLKRLGIRVEEFKPAYSLADIAMNLRRMGDLVGERSKAETLITNFDADLKKFEEGHPAQRPLAAFYYSNSYTSGGDTLAGEIATAAGLRNLGAELGLKQTMTLPLEVLVMSNPDLVIKGRTYDAPALAQEVFEHPALKFVQRQSDEALVADKYTICGTPFTLHAVARLSEARKRLQSRTEGADDHGHRWADGTR
ncbi:MAG: ABC transporter substrate-binding protein [Hyphomicrobiaceae bacterium]